MRSTIAERPKGREAQVGRREPADKLKDECGVFGIFGHPEAANLTYLGLYALQHRGQESAGIATSDHREIRCSKSMGHVADIFTPEAIGSTASPLILISPPIPGVSLPRPEFILGPRKARTRGPGSGPRSTSAFATLRRDAEPSPFSPARGGRLRPVG